MSDFLYMMKLIYFVFGEDKKILLEFEKRLSYHFRFRKPKPARKIGERDSFA